VSTKGVLGLTASLGIRSGNETQTTAARLDSLATEGDRISARLAFGEEEHVLAYRVSGTPLPDRYEPFLVAAIPMAMRRGAALSVPEPVSARLLDALPTVQRILNAWDEELRIVDVHAPREAVKLDGERGAASFFSGGVDSFYTVLRNLEALDTLVHVHGFDISAENRPICDRMSRSINAAAAELGRPLIEVETNLRRTSDRFCKWWLYHGAFLASVALLLAPAFRRVLVPASYSYRELIRRGSHALLDPLWSTEAVEIVHEGAVRRVEKLEAISASEVAMRRLHVCWDEDADYNCGRCGKCLRTMAGLRIVGGLDRCQTLPHRVPLRALSRIPVRTENDLTVFRGSLQAAEARNADPELIRALRRLVRRGSLYMTLKPRGRGNVARGWARVGRVERWARRHARRSAGTMKTTPTEAGPRGSSSDRHRGGRTRVAW
jgi:hypothetical protein